MHTSAAIPDHPNHALESSATNHQILFQIIKIPKKSYLELSKVSKAMKTDQVIKKYKNLSNLPNIIQQDHFEVGGMTGYYWLFMDLAHERRHFLGTPHKKVLRMCQKNAKIDTSLFKVKSIKICK